MTDSGFRYLDHVSDLVIEATGRTMDDAFVNSARGLVDSMFEISNISPNLEVLIEATGHDLKNLLYNWLEKVLLFMLVDEIVISNFKTKIFKNQSSYSIKGNALGEKIDLHKHIFKIEIKGITYHEMEINQHSDGVIIRFMLDL